MIESETEPDDSRREVLVRLYDQLINRDTVLIQTIFIVVGAGVTAIPLLLVNVHPYVAGHGSGYVHHAWDYLALPLIPTVVGGLLGFLTLHVQFVAQYGHAIE
jgi:H+/Cl- antiporter ClcA